MYSKYIETEINENFVKLKDYYFAFQDKRDIILTKFILNAVAFSDGLGNYMFF